MKILVIGSGRREHALVKSFKLSPLVSEIHVIPGSDGMAQEALCHPEISWKNFESIKHFCLQFNIDFVMIGPEDPLVAGLTDYLRQHGIHAVGPDIEAAQLEGSKITSKQFMIDAKISTAFSKVVQSIQDIKTHLPLFTPPYVLKADGLCAGKGVFICDTEAELINAAELLFEKKIFQKAGEKALLEQFTKGFEISLILLTNGSDYHILPLAQDHKRLMDNQKGPNTGGMGTVAPVELEPSVMKILIEQVVEPSISQIRKQQMTYRGLLFIGLMMTEEGPSVLEYNTRFGDPETQVLLPLIESDTADLFYHLAKGELKKIHYKKASAACVVKSALGYPDTPRTGDKITGLPIEDSATGWVIFSAVKKEDQQYFTNGGRVLSAVGVGANLSEALKEAYRIANQVSWSDCHQRSDIGAAQLKN